MSEPITEAHWPVSGLRALLNESVDYAGLFPPANLPLERALRNYVSYRPSPDDWLLARFVCPSAKLEKLRILKDALPDESVPRLSVLGLPGSISGLRVEAIEVALPAESGGQDRETVRNLLHAVAENIERLGTSEITPFFEVTVEERWRTVASALVEAINEHNRCWQGRHCRPAAFKLRTGGPTPEAIPKIDDLAFVIKTCRRLGVAFKCTAGLHHPFRHYNDAMQARMHGFLNVFVAAALAQSHSIGERELNVILDDENPGSFQFDEAGLSWQGWRAEIDQIREARKSLISSFGSCSFEEPLGDLRELGLL